jgi:hypothetical protein
MFNKTEYRKKLYVRKYVRAYTLNVYYSPICWGAIAFINFLVKELKTHLERNEKGRISLEHQLINIKDKRKWENISVIVLDECEERSSAGTQTVSTVKTSSKNNPEAEWTNGKAN